MSNISISSVPERLHIRLQPNKIVLPGELQQKITGHWNKLTEANHTLFNGEVFTIAAMDDNSNELSIELQQTDFAHHLYSKQIGGLGEHQTKVIHPCAMIVTKDDYMVFGAMGDQTSSPGEILCCGGGIDLQDVVGETVHIERTMAKELREELAVDVTDSQRVAAFTPTYLIANNDLKVWSVVYIVRLRQTAQEFHEAYSQFVHETTAQGELPEFKKLYNLPRSAEEVEHFILAHESHLGGYMSTLLRAMC